MVSMMPASKRLRLIAMGALLLTTRCMGSTGVGNSTARAGADTRCSVTPNTLLTVDCHINGVANWLKSVHVRRSQARKRCNACCSDASQATDSGLRTSSLPFSAASRA